MPRLSRQGHRSWRAREALCRLAYEAALAVVARAEGIDADDLRPASGRRPSGRISALRHQAIYLTVVTYDLPGKWVARVAGVDKSAVVRGLRRMEDARDQDDVDRTLERYADELRSVA